MKNRILNLLKLVEVTFEQDLNIYEQGNVIEYYDIDNELNSMLICENDDIMFNMQIITFNELVDILTNNDPYTLL